LSREVGDLPVPLTQRHLARPVHTCTGAGGGCRDQPGYGRMPRDDFPGLSGRGGARAGQTGASHQVRRAIIQVARRIPATAQPVRSRNGAAEIPSGGATTLSRMTCAIEANGSTSWTPASQFGSRSAGELIGANISEPISTMLVTMPTRVGFTA